MVGKLSHSSRKFVNLALSHPFIILYHFMKQFLFLFFEKLVIIKVVVVVVVEWPRMAEYS